MSENKLLSTALILIGMLLPWEARADGDLKRGEIVAKVRCFVCHHFFYNAGKAGPSLKEIYNKKPTIKGVPFTKWDAESLDRWIVNPKKVKFNTTMVFPGLKKEQDRKDVITFLKTL